MSRFATGSVIAARFSSAGEVPAMPSPGDHYVTPARFAAPDFEALHQQGIALPADDDEGWICGRCTRGQCGRCADAACVCCSGNPQDLPRLPGGCWWGSRSRSGLNRGGAQQRNNSCCGDHQAALADRARATTIPFRAGIAGHSRWCAQSAPLVVLSGPRHRRSRTTSPGGARTTSHFQERRLIPIAERSLVQVWWTDATNVAGGWHDPEDLSDFATNGAWEASNTGWLVHEDDLCYVLAGRMTDDGRNVGLIERIPKRAVTRLVRFTPPRAPVEDRAADFAGRHGSFSLHFDAGQNSASPDYRPWTLVRNESQGEAWGALTQAEAFDWATAELESTE